MPGQVGSFAQSCRQSLHSVQATNGHVGQRKVECIIVEELKVLHSCHRDSVQQRMAVVLLQLQADEVLADEEKNKPGCAQVSARRRQGESCKVQAHTGHCQRHLDHKAERWQHPRAARTQAAHQLLSVCIRFILCWGMQLALDAAFVDYLYPPY